MCYRSLARFFESLDDRPLGQLALMASLGDLPTEIAQKCVEFLEFDEAIEVKSVSRGLRKAARRALTRGHWRPIRFISEHGLATLRNCSQGGLNSLDDGVVATFRAAWALRETCSNAPGRIPEPRYGTNAGP